MIHYFISYQKPHRHFIDFKVTFPHTGEEKMQIQLPSWRPGRYELGNFAKNIGSWQAFDLAGNKLSFRKLKKDLWEVDAKDLNKVVVEYSYFANELNAGSTYLDEDQLYINPVNCFLYLPHNQETSFELEFDLPRDYEFATGMASNGKHKLHANNVQEVMDCPLIASATLQHETYEVQNKKYHIWIQGEHTIDTDLFVEDHRKFTEAQVTAFGGIPCDEYHFMYHFPPYRARHGVEHSNSTVIALGPGKMLHFKHVYQEVIGISCHELYHTWNIKSIRPKEMLPYDFTKENYSELGYVAEGVTTYFGDQYLLRTGTFTEEEYYRALGKEIEKHLHNPGRFNLSVAASSFDTWLDGYGAGIPWRKVSIYTEGSLIAFICDSRIIHATQGKKSLDDVMKLMYDKFGKNHLGYTREDYQSILEGVSGMSFEDIFTKLYHGTDDYYPYLLEAADQVGLSIELKNNSKEYVSLFGFQANDKQEVTTVLPNSPSDEAGLWIGDKIIAINNESVQFSINQVMPKAMDELTIHYYRHNELRKIVLKPNGERYFPSVRVTRNQKEFGFYKAWHR